MANWTRIIPTTPGHYWFYGWLHGKDLLQPYAQLTVVERRHVNDRLDILVANGEMITGSGEDKIVGLWLAVPTPELPELE